ncbi:MAG: response regulator transcription factor [Candidatus Eremiobacteraeota bacterium]|nr:response regulator transcription factor [Candidatus Eremiobacteraeota bacterium]
MSAARTRPIEVGIVADRDTTRRTLLAVLAHDHELRVVGTAAGIDDGARLLDLPNLRVMLVNLDLSAPSGPAPGVEFIRRSKERRPDVGILSLKRRTEEHLLRAALDAGADACCLATTSQTRLLQAIKAVAEGATWLDPEISRILLHPLPAALGHQGVPGVHLSPRERDILRLVTDGYTNDEIAERLTCATATIKTHLLHLFSKLGVHDRVSAAVAALRGGLL